MARAAFANDNTTRLDDFIASNDPLLDDDLGFEYDWVIVQLIDGVPVHQPRLQKDEKALQQLRAIMMNRENADPRITYEARPARPA